MDVMGPASREPEKVSSVAFPHATPQKEKTVLGEDELIGENYKAGGEAHSVCTWAHFLHTPGLMPFQS